MKETGKRRQCRADRLEHARRFRIMLADMGLSPLEAAKMLHVSLRTLQNWLSGHHEVPYAAYKLLRLMRYMELPGDSWRGWHFSCGKLVTPEGRTISGKDGSWWSLLVQQAHSFGRVYKELNALKAAHSAGPAPRELSACEVRSALAPHPLPNPGDSVMKSPVTLHPSLKKITKPADPAGAGTLPDGMGFPVTPHPSPASWTNCPKAVQSVPPVPSWGMPSAGPVTLTWTDKLVTRQSSLTGETKRPFRRSGGAL